MRNFLPAVLAILLTVFPANAQKAKEANPAPRLVIPPVIYAVPGTESAIYFNNATLPEPEEPFRFAVTCKIGRVDGEKRWVIDAATDPAPGDYPLTLSLKSSAGEVLDSASTVIRVVPKDAGKGEDIALLIVGDSLTNASQYPNEIARLLSRPGNPKWKMLGTHHPASAAENVFHEGYGGWTWARFNTQYAPDQPQTGKLRTSPFLFHQHFDPEMPVKLNVSRYIEKFCEGRPPDFVTFLLGINDCFHVNPDDPAAVEARIDLMIREAEKLLAEFRRAAPDAELGICLTPPGNSRDGAFEANYKGRYPRWGWRRIQYRLVERQIEHFGGREDDNIFIVPTSLNLDTTEGYPENNGVHPNTAGYNQIGSSIYGWLKWRLAEKD